MALKRFSDSFPYCTKWGFSKELEMYQWIGLNRSHVSYFTGKPLSQLRPWNFIHVLPKKQGSYPHFRLNPDAVVLGTLEEHKLIDEGTLEERLAYKKKNPNYQIEAFYNKQQRLIDLYREEFKDQ